MTSGRAIRAVIIADDGIRKGKLDRQCKMLRAAYPGIQVAVACRPGSGPCPHGIQRYESRKDEGTARMAALAIEGCVRKAAIILPLGVFPGMEAVRPTASAAIWGGREGQLPGMNVADGAAVHFAYGALCRWTGAVVLAGADKLVFVQAAESGPSSWLLHEALNEAIHRGVKLEARARTLDRMNKNAMIKAED